jgi:hypothetical protein
MRQMQIKNEIVPSDPAQFARLARPSREEH